MAKLKLFWAFFIALLIVAVVAGRFDGFAKVPTAPNNPSSTQVLLPVFKSAPPHVVEGPVCRKVGNWLVTDPLPVQILVGVIVLIVGRRFQSASVKPGPSGPGTT